MFRTLAIASLVVLAQPASATLIDFTSSAFAGAHGREAFSTTVDGVGLTVLEAQPVGAELYLTSDGLGIDSPWGIEDPGEIGVPELLVVSFDSKQFIEEVYVSQLFVERGWLGDLKESGWYSIDGAAKIYFEATGDPDGLLTVLVNQEATSISFGAKLAGLSHDYSLSGLNVRGLTGGTTAIPEPGPAFLFAIGGIVVSAAVRRRVN